MTNSRPDLPSVLAHTLPRTARGSQPAFFAIAIDDGDFAISSSVQHHFTFIPLFAPFDSYYASIMYNFISVLLLLGSCHIGLSQASDPLTVSTDGSCGLSSNYTCLNSSFGSCCSSKGFCGATNEFCNPTAGCQPDYGSCSTNTSYISYDGKCGSTDPNSQVCVGSTFGSCCSAKGWCGGTSDYCGVGCQSDYGTCGGANTTVVTGPDSSASASSSAAPSTLSTISTSRSVTSGSATSTPTADSANSTSASSQHSSQLTGYKAAIGILAALVAILAAALAFVLLQRRRRSTSKQHQDTIPHGIAAEKADTEKTSSTYEQPPPPPSSTAHTSTAPPFSAGPFPSYICSTDSEDKSSMVASNNFQSFKGQNPVELGGTSYVEVPGNKE